MSAFAGYDDWLTADLDRQYADELEWEQFLEDMADEGHDLEQLEVMFEDPAFDTVPF